MVALGSQKIRAMDMHDLRRRLYLEISKHNFILRDGHARSPQRIALGNQKTQLYQHSAFRALGMHDLRRGFTCRNHVSEVLRLPCDVKFAKQAYATLSQLRTAFKSFFGLRKGSLSLKASGKNEKNSFQSKNGQKKTIYSCFR